MYDLFPPSLLFEAHVFIIATSHTPTHSHRLKHSLTLILMDSHISYNYARYGCPKRVFHQSNGFRPIVDLYDGDQFM
jgi:hypothetical protein